MTEDPAPPGSLALSPDPCGWLSDLPEFCGAQPRVVRLKLQQFVRDAGAEQLRAWDESIPWLQRECKEAVDAYDAARTWSTILEYELPREGRRPYVIVLENGVVVVLALRWRAPRGRRGTCSRVGRGRASRGRMRRLSLRAPA